MTLPELAIRRPVATLTIIACAVVLGLVALDRLVQPRVCGGVGEEEVLAEEARLVAGGCAQKSAGRYQAHGSDGQIR